MDTNLNLGQMQQKMTETLGDHEARSQEGFQEAERDLPQHIGSRFNIPFADNLSSVLGGHNPLAKAVDPATDIVWLLDNTAYRPVHIYPHAPQPWQAEFVAAYFVKNSGKDVSKWVADIADKIGLGQDGESRAEGEATIAKRLQPFVDTIQPARFVQVTFPTGHVQTLGPGGRNAISSHIVETVGEYEDGDRIMISADPPEVAIHGAMVTHFAAPDGWAVISDIDDSIKITMTPSPIGILKSTFVNEPTPISGMPQLYDHISRTLSPAWFYLSASPYNLYTFLRPFLHQHYPQGTIILRDASWMNLSGFLESLTQGTEEYKNSRVMKIHDWLPKRKILCVGDSTQSDPEVYGDMYRRYKGWIKAIFIRKVVDVSEIHKTEKNEPSRFEKAFRGVPDDVWKVFNDPSELYEAVDALKRT